MSNTCPKRINIYTNKIAGETDEQYIERIYGMFLPILNTLLKLTYRGKTISIPDYGEDIVDKNRAFFNHLISYNEETKKYNYQRLATCCLLPSIIMNGCDSSCSFLFDKQAKKEKNRRTLFCVQHGYVIVYLERKESIYLITGYHVARKNYHKFM